MMHRLIGGQPENYDPECVPAGAGLALQLLLS